MSVEMTQRKKPWLILLLVLLCFATRAAAEKPYLLHLPGVGGHLPIDDALIGGLRQGGLDAEVQIYDWTAGQPGMAALMNYQQNREQAAVIAELIQRVRRESPSRRIIITSHSGGAGLAAWALERLPDDVHVQSLLMLAPALSPEYDLTTALRHVTGRVYVFSSLNDTALGAGTRTFGTIDRVKSDSAGRAGFVRPQSADPSQYEKVVTHPYDPAWLPLGHGGEHIGPMSRPFARRVLAPLLLTDELPKILPSTAPATRTVQRNQEAIK
jgi:hypothetical protein